MLKAESTPVDCGWLLVCSGLYNSLRTSLLRQKHPTYIIMIQSTAIVIDFERRLRHRERYVTIRAVVAGGWGEGN